MHWWQGPVHAFLVHSLVPGESERLYFVAWTLGYEALFYALVPLAAVLVWRTMRRPGGIDLDRVAALVFGAWALTVVWGLALALADPFGPGRPMRPVFTVLYVGIALGNFCPGMLVFLAETRDAATRGGWWARYRALSARPGPPLLLAAAALAVAAWAPWTTNPFVFVLFQLVVGIGSGAFLASVLNGAWAARPARVLAPVGLISYGIYLWHWIVLTVLKKHGVYLVGSFSAPATLVHAVLLFLLTIPFALGSWLVIERPLLRRTTLWDRGRRGALQPTPDSTAPRPAQAITG